ncbi:alpha/beta fold hydrolase [Caulobacter rhizosphaerae]|jgi:pimeloyl-ACP methyl ester carboxylesterase|uniref:alpha/beta fold hydrolase n=1 Tax=Caulobacter rhizosphaerae TaxID=2010972 RepID=UPI0013D18F18|nr:alpha/beta hydrolase [Caulobacter rhizosphaerae]GGL10953.1 hydrolase [Caulobacter rhizosphaerae]
MDRRSFLTAAIAAASGDGFGPLPSAASRDVLRFRAKLRRLNLPQGRIAYADRGVGPVALFIHGFPLNGYQWRGALDRLSDQRRCLAPDLMGLGYTEVSNTQDLSPQAQSDMLVALLDGLSVGAVDLIANDSGGTIAQLFATQHPARVRTLLLTNCDVHENSPPPQMAGSIAKARAGVYDQKIALHLDDRVYARSANGIGGGAYVDPASFSDDALEYYFRPLVASPERRSQLNRYLAAFEPNPLLAIEPALRRSAIPARMVWGTADPLFPVQWAEWLDRTLPKSRGIRLVEGGKLFWPEERPDILASEAKTLWAGQPG